MSPSTNPQSNHPSLTTEEVSNNVSRNANLEEIDTIPGSTNPSLFGNEIEFLIKQQFADSLEQNRGERVKYAKCTFWLTCFWILVVLGFIFCSGYRLHSEKMLEISDKVLLTLISTTTINVFGFFLLVMKFLFNKEELAALAFLFNPQSEKLKPIAGKSRQLSSKSAKMTKEKKIKE